MLRERGRRPGGGPGRASQNKLFIAMNFRVEAGMEIGMINGGKTRRRYWLGDGLITGELAVIGMAEISNLASVFLDHPFSHCTVIMPVLTVALLIATAGNRIARRHAGTATKKGDPIAEKETDWTKRFAYVVAAALFAFQLLTILSGNAVYRQGDMTVETVTSFLETDAVYSVNPLTGQAYTEGLPVRIKILCLPMLYGSICLMTGLSPQFVVWRLVPALTLSSSYLAFWLLGGALFPRDGRKRAFFLAGYALILWAGSYMYGMDGFGALFCGFRGVTIRNQVLLPWLFSLLLRKKRLSAALCIAAEACIVWTLYGLGVCAAVTVGMAAADFAVRLFKGRKGVAR